MRRGGFFYVKQYCDFLFPALSRFCPACPAFVPFLFKWDKRKSRKRLYYQSIATSLLRRQDSNMRPPGYEPGELPTAPLRDVISHLRVQRYGEIFKYPNNSTTFLRKWPFFAKKYHFSNIFAFFSCSFARKSLYLHTINECAIFKHSRGLNNVNIKNKTEAR